MLRLLILGCFTFSLSSAFAGNVNCVMNPPIQKFTAGEYVECRSAGSGDIEAWKVFGSQQISEVVIKFKSGRAGVVSNHEVTLKDLPNSMNRMQNYANKDFLSNPFIASRIKTLLPGTTNLEFQGIVGFKTEGELLLTGRATTSTGGGAPPPKIPPYNPNAVQ